MPALAGLFAIAWGAAPWTAKLRSANDDASRRTDAASHDPNARNHELVALTADPGTEYFPAISPDGALIAYVGTEPGKYDAALQVKSRDPGARAVTLVPAAHHSFMAHPIWSPDGTRIAYAQISEAGCELRAVPVTGGTPRAIAPCNANVMDAFDWSAASDALYLSEARDDEGAGARALATIDLATGKRTPLTYAPRAVGDVDLYPRVSPDGRWLAFRRGVRPYADIWVMPIDGGQARRVARLGSSQNGMAWLPDSTGLIVSSDHGGPQALHRVDVNDGSVIPLGIDNAHSPAVARNAGYVVFHRDLELAQLVAFDLDARGHVGAGRVIAPASRSDFAASLSRGGQRLAFVSDRSGTPQVWVYDFERAQTTMLTRLVEATPDFLEWSPDERHLLYVRRGRGSSELVRVDRDSGRELVLNHAGERIRFGSYGQDGETIFYAADRGDGWKLWRMRADGGAATPLGVAGLDPRQHPGDARVYYNKLSWRGLYRIDPEQGREEVVTNLVSYLSHGAYRVHGDRLWLYERIDADRGVLSSRPADGGLAADAELRDETTLTLDGGHPLPMASIDAGVTRIVVNMITRDGADVYVATLAPPTTP